MEPTNRNATADQANKCPHNSRQGTKNLVVCIDGTSNRFGQNNTNVLKLFDAIQKQPKEFHDCKDTETKQPEQYAYYSSGLGTRLKSSNPFKRVQNFVADKLDRAFAWNKDKSIKDSYGWLAKMYQEGDQIYLFGFSRGAYQVRVLAAMIHEVGLIRTLTEAQIPTAYHYYEAIRRGDAGARPTAGKFKNMFAWHDLRVHFVGVWDTVSSVGLITQDVFLSTSRSAAHACHFRHALALDERRVMFTPEHFCEMNSPKDDKTTSATVKEVWFAGDHSDVGGFDCPGRSHQAGTISLLWMSREAVANGLILQPMDIIWDLNHLDFSIPDSIEARWRLLEYLPIKHKVSFTGSGNYGRRLHQLRPRCIVPGQKLHTSILYAKEYEPLAKPRGGLPVPVSYTEPQDMELDDERWETGLFDGTAIQDLLSRMKDPRRILPIYLDRLLFMLQFKEGRQSLAIVPNWPNRFKEVINNVGSVPLVKLMTLVAYYEASCVFESHSECNVSLEPSQEVFKRAEECLDYILKEPKHRDSRRVLALLKPLTKHKILREHILSKKLQVLLEWVVGQLRENFAQAMHGLSYLLECGDVNIRQVFVAELTAEPPNSEICLSRILDVEDPRILTSVLRMVLVLARLPEKDRVPSIVKSRLRKLTERKGLVGLLSVEILLGLSATDQLDIRNRHVQANLARALLNSLSPNKLDGSGCAPGRKLNGLDPVLRQLFGIADSRPENPQPKRLKKAARIVKFVQVVQSGNTRERTAATMTLLKLCEIDAVRTHVLRTKLLNVLIDQLKRKDKALLAAYALAICFKYKEMKEESMKKSKRLASNIVTMLKLSYFDDAIGHVEGFQVFGDLMQHDDLRKEVMKYETGLLKTLEIKILKPKEPKTKDRITEVLEEKLKKGEANDVRTSLVCLDILRSLSDEGPTAELVDRGLKYLQGTKWKTQKVGVTILSVLAQTEHGVKKIEQVMPQIFAMLLPGATSSTPASEVRRADENTGQETTRTSPTPAGEGRRVDEIIRQRTSPASEDQLANESVRHEASPTITSVSEDQHDESIVQETRTAITTPGSEGQRIEGVGQEAATASPNPVSESQTKLPASQMMGPACVLRNLARNKKLRDRMVETDQFYALKDRYLSGNLIIDGVPKEWQVFTPDQADVNEMLGKIFGATEVGLSEENLMLIGDKVLPHIQHWDRFLLWVCNWTVIILSPLLALIGISAAVLVVLGKIALLVAGLKFGAVLGLVALPAYAIVRLGRGVQRTYSTLMRSRFVEILASFLRV